MTEPLLHYEKPPHAVTFVLAHLLPIADGPNQLGTRRWSVKMPLPYWMVSRVGGVEDEFSDYPVIRVHAFGETETLASRAMDRAHERMRKLIYNPTIDVTLGDGTVANCEWARCTEGPLPMPYRRSPIPSQTTVTPDVLRFVTTYELALTFVAA